MAVNVGKQVQSYAVGGVDSVLQWYDEKNGRIKPFKKWQDWGRVGGHLLGLAAQIWMPKYSTLGETVAISTGPLVVNSLVAVARNKTTSSSGSASRAGSYVQRRAASPPASPVSASSEIPGVPIPPQYE